MSRTIHQRLAVAAVALLMGASGVSLWYVQRPASGPGAEKQTFASAILKRRRGEARIDGGFLNFQKKRTGSLPERPAVEPLPPAPLANPDDRSPLADELNRPETTPAGNLEIVHNLFAAYRERFGGIPTGEDNATIVNALTGNNPRRIAFIDRTHPAINARGELVDRWGTPLFFHLESQDAWEIRSAGLDREMYTEDDIRKCSPRAAIELGGNSGG